MKGYKTLFTLAIAVVLVVVFSGTGLSLSRDELNKFKEQTIMAPDFTLKDLDGKSYKLSDYRGKAIIVLETGSST